MEAAHTEPPRADEANRRQRRVLVTALIVLASLLAFISVFSIWANRQLLETDNWVETSSELLEDEEIRTQLANFMVDELYANVDVQAELAARLPPDLQPLAGPAAAGIRQLTDRVALEALERPRIQSLWEDINRATHEKLVTVIEDDTGEPVVLDVGDIVSEVGAQAGIDIASRLPPDAGQIEILPPDELTAAQDAVNLIEKLTIFVTVLALLLMALAVYLAKGWRREALRSVGIAFIVIGVAIGVARGLAGDVVVEALASTAAVEPAITDTYDIGTRLLSDGAGAMILYGVFIFLGAWLAGPTAIARSVRRFLAPLLNQRGAAYAALLLFLLLLFWWSPTEGFRRLPIATLIVLGFAVGFEVLRRQVVREFPDETWETASERLRAGTRSIRGRG
jgi:hypothetical protein